MENVAYQNASMDLRQAGQFLFQHQLTWGNAGNMSVRLGDRRFLITASGTRLGQLSEQDFVLCDVEGAILSQGKPSKEMPMHRAVYEMRPEIQAVIHASPFYATLLSCSTLDVPNNWFVEAMYYLERVVRIPYYHPGSKELGEAVREKALQANVLLLENHGVLVFDVSLQEALMALQTLEVACRMVIMARSAGLEIQPLNADTVTDFLTRSGYRKPRQWSA